jgi:hypothetical protein
MLRTYGCWPPNDLQGQYGFGARTGLAPILFGLVLFVLALGFADTAAQLFAVVPISAVGALLIMAGTDLALSRRLFDGRPSCWPVIGATALVTLYKQKVCECGNRPRIRNASVKAPADVGRGRS